jgi:lipopolysaccharide export system protein LptA
MNKKTLFQFFLLFIALLIPVTVFYTYFKSEEPIKTEIPKKIVEDNNQIEKLEYVSFDKVGNRYTIKASTGDLENEQILVDGEFFNVDIIYMRNVIASIELNNKEIIIIKSKTAKYNTFTYETNFKEDVGLEYLDVNASSDNLDLLFKDNLITLYDNLVFKQLSTTLIADKMLINTNEGKYEIFMNDTNQNVKITNTIK